MARGTLAIQTSSRTGDRQINFTAADATDKHEFSNAGADVLLIINNAHVSSHVVTVKRPAVIDGVTLNDITYTVPAGEIWMVGPFPKGIYNQSGDVVYVDPPATPTALSFAVIHVGG